MQRLFRQFSFPGGVPSHVAPETPGSIHEGGELGYSLSHAFGAAFDNPDLVVACVVGDGEAETGPLATSWHSNKFLDPGRRRRGAADPAPQRLQDRESDGARAHPRRRARRSSARATAGSRTSSRATIRRSCTSSSRRRSITCSPRSGRSSARARGRRLGACPRWPMIVLRTPKGWTGPKVVDGLPVEGTWRAHQVPLVGVREKPEHLAAARGVDALVPSRGAVRRRRRVRGRRRRLAAAGDAAHGREPARERRPAAARSRAARLPRLRGRGAERRRTAGGGDARARSVPARRVPAATPSRATSGCSARTRPRRTGSTRCTRRPTKTWEARSSPVDERCAGRPRHGDPVRDDVPGLARGLPADRAATGCSRATKRSRTSSTRCSTSTRSG